MSPEDLIFAGYVTCALWSSTDESDASGGNPLDDSYGPDDIAEDSKAAMQVDCAAFWREAGPLLDDLSDNDLERAGHDFWLTRNGHGVGFWDGDWPEPMATQLTELCEKLGSAYLYIGDDGLIHYFSD